MVSLSAELGVPPGYIRIADVGAAFFGRDPPYQALIEAGTAKRFAFEPDEGRLDELRGHLEPSAVLLPYALGTWSPAYAARRAGRDEFAARTRSRRMEFLTPFGMPPFMPLGESERTAEIATRRLDDVEEIPGIDFLKIDIQGAELMVLRSGRAKLRDCAFIQIEMSFFALYKDQPGFAEVDTELRAQGFMAHGLAEMARMPIAPYRPDDLWLGLNQLVEIDMLYVRNVKHPDALTSDQLEKTALIADACYGSFDLATRCLAELERRGDCPPGLAERYAAETYTRSRRMISHSLPAWD